MPFVELVIGTLLPACISAITMAPQWARRLSARYIRYQRNREADEERLALLYPNCRERFHFRESINRRTVPNIIFIMGLVLFCILLAMCDSSRHEAAKRWVPTSFDSLEGVGGLSVEGRLKMAMPSRMVRGEYLLHTLHAHRLG